MHPIWRRSKKDADHFSPELPTWRLKKPHAHKKGPLGAALFGLKESHHALGGAVVVFCDAVFVLDHLAVKFVHQIVDRGVQVLMGTLCEQVTALDVDVAFCTLAFVFFFLIFNGQQHFHIDHLIEMPGDAIEFPRDVLAQSRGHFQMVSADG